jgi:hypothetical protein
VTHAGDSRAVCADRCLVRVGGRSGCWRSATACQLAGSTGSERIAWVGGDGQHHCVFARCRHVSGAIEAMAIMAVVLACGACASSLAEPGSSSPRTTQMAPSTSASAAGNQGSAEGSSANPPAPALGPDPCGLIGTPTLVIAGKKLSNDPLASQLIAISKSESTVSVVGSYATRGGTLARLSAYVVPPSKQYSDQIRLLGKSDPDVLVSAEAIAHGLEARLSVPVGTLKSGSRYVVVFTFDVRPSRPPLARTCTTGDGYTQVRVPLEVS